MQLIVFNNVTDEKKAEAIENLISSSSPRQDFFVMIFLSVLMATFGLLMDNIPIVIGSMLIAPLLYPILSLALGIVMADAGLIGRSIKTLLIALVLSIIASSVIAFVFASSNRFSGSELLSSVEPTLSYGIVAAIAGIAASIALFKPALHRVESFPGIAISVALIPPLGSAGIGLAQFDIVLFFEALMLFLLNVVGIVFASMIVFSMMQLYSERYVAKQAVEEDNQEIQKEQMLAEENSDN